MRKTAGNNVSCIIAQGHKDLWNSHVSGTIGGVLLVPMREFVIDPAFAILKVLLPPLVESFPTCGPIIIGTLNLQLYALEFFYPVPSVGQDMRSRAINDFRVNNSRVLSHVPKFKPPSDLSSTFRGSVAFTVSALADIVSLFLDQRKISKWWSAVRDLKGYLHVSGIGTEWEEAIYKPLVGGRLLGNLKILHEIQLSMYSDRCKRVSTAGHNDIRDSILVGKRLMRFATAAYGTEMVRSALDREALHDEVDDHVKAIAFHCNIPTSDIKILHVDDGGDMMVLRHFVAVDRESRALVLSLRGTLSISGALIDIQAMDAPFQGCRAHKGMAEMAANVWDCSGEKIRKLFNDDEFKDYTLIVTGHSLGAGTACLLHLKLHVEKLLGEHREVRCFGFAPPPTISFGGLEPGSSVGKAIENTICFVHDNDCVPFLSVSCVRRLARLLDVVDNKTQAMSVYRRFRMFWGWDPLSSDLVEDVREADEAKEDESGLVQLWIPAKFIVWMKKQQPESFHAFACSPHAFAKENIFLCEDLLTDHLVEPYEDALDALAETMCTNS